MSEQSSTLHFMVSESAKNRDESWQSTLQEMGRSLHETTFVVIDLETTGGAPHLGAAITEIGAVKVKSGKILGEFKTFVNPEHPVPSYITELTGITDAMVYQAPTIATIFPTLLEFLGSPQETVLVAQNAPFDLSFLKYAARAHAFSWPDFPILDTAIIARKVLSRDEVPNCQLATLSAFFGTSTTPNHRALDDAKATVDVLHGLIERVAGLDIYTLEELMNFGKRIKKPKSPASRPPTS
jgi:DNA polymerase III epsilon subunit family exonuclease